jgi:hypothetical protein
MEGKQMKNLQPQGLGDQTVDVSNFPAGIYHAIITDTDGGIHRKKLLIKK